MKIDTSKFATKEALFDYLRENKTKILTAKKAEMKHADAVCVPIFNSDEHEVTDKAFKVPENNDVLKQDKFSVKAIINTTGLLDSHGDVHIPGLWNKSIKENKMPFLLKEHNMKFDYVISDEVKASVADYTWKELGQPYEGTTQALVYDADITTGKAAGMDEKYANGKVKQHSVGMYYVKIALAMNSNDQRDKEEKKIWDKYHPIIANKEAADERGFFWAVTEAKQIEGSAVLLGSNFVTPTIEITGEPSEDTQKNMEPDKSTPKSIINVLLGN